MNFKRRIQCDTFVSKQTKRRFSHYLTKSIFKLKEHFFSFSFSYSFKGIENTQKNNKMKRFVEYLSFGYAANMNKDLETRIQWLMPSFWSFYFLVIFSLFVYLFLAQFCRVAVFGFVCFSCMCFFLFTRMQPIRTMQFVPFDRCIISIHLFPFQQ